MTINTDSGRTLHLHFVHSSHNFQSRPGAGAQRAGLDKDAANIGRRLTLCEISEVTTNGDATGDNGESYNVLGQGVAVCHPNDTFKKPVGRKLALTAALKASGLEFADRDSVWKSYLTTFGIVKN